MTAADRLAQIRARVEAATEGPWGWFPGPLSPAPKYLDSGTEEGGYTGVISCAALTYPAKPDADFIAHARADIPALLAAVEAGIEACDREIADARLGEKYAAETNDGRVLHIQSERRYTAEQIRRAIERALS